MHHHHQPDNNSQMQQQLNSQWQQQQFFDWVMLSNQWRTNRILEENAELANQTNQLLEQIRRQQLTPAERTREDQQRARAKVLRAAEEQLEREQQHTIGFWALFFLTAVIGLFAISSALQAHPGTQAQAIPVAAPSPDYAPRAELVRLPNQ
jgi:hypothetical protein